MSRIPTGTRKQQLVVLAPVLALHVALLIGLSLAMRPSWPPSPVDSKRPARAPLVVRLLASPPVGAGQAPVGTPSRSSSPARPPVARSRPPAPVRSPGDQPITEPTAAPHTAANPEPQAPVSATAATAATAANASAAASSTPAAPSLLDSEATRQALRDAARGPLLQERAAAATASGLPATQAERLSAGIAAGARGDCLKGEYPGGGAGLLSLPFLALAALNDKCRR